MYDSRDELEATARRAQRRTRRFSASRELRAYLNGHTFLDPVKKLFHILVTHPDAALRCVPADRLRLIGSVDAVLEALRRSLIPWGTSLILLVGHS